MRSTNYFLIDSSEPATTVIHASVWDVATGREYDFASGGFVPAGSATSPTLAMGRLPGRRGNCFRAVLDLPDPPGDSDYLVTYHASPTGPAIFGDYALPDGAISFPLGPVAGPSAVFVGRDATTQGSWSPRYGSEGYLVVGGDVQLPSSVSITPRGHEVAIWSPSTTEPQALVKVPGSAARVASCLYSATNFTVDVTLTDGRWHRLSAYLVDWDRRSRDVLVEVLSAATGAVLDSRRVANFAAGTYLTWGVTGAVRLRFTRMGPANAVVSGLFLGTSG